VYPRYFANPSIHLPSASRKTPPQPARCKLDFAAPSILSAHQPFGGPFHAT
ncbi:hypothetical protein A2U01_0052061, partial [Trifolium medium]|nr:hypothetical protein [Trifolium medium]